LNHPDTLYSSGKLSAAVVDISSTVDKAESYFLYPAITNFSTGFVHVYEGSGLHYKANFYNNSGVSRNEP